MAAVTTIRVYTGTGAGTESAAETAIAWESIDSATVAPGSNQVAAGTNSYEKWIRVKLDTANGSSVTGFWVERTGGALPTGVVIKMGVTDTAATPTAATSTVATTTMADGRRYFFDANTYDTSGQTSRYLVIQEQVAAATASGAIPQQSLTFGYSEG
jgi:hypothetical protein